MSSITFEHDTNVILGSSHSPDQRRFRWHFQLPSSDYVCPQLVQKRQLAALDDRMLQDIGLERADIHGKVWGVKRTAKTLRRPIRPILRRLEKAPGTPSPPGAFLCPKLQLKVDGCQLFSQSVLQFSK